MEKFNLIYPFTTENIAGYMQDIDLTGKKIITVTGSTDHIINAILKGACDISTFDINMKAKYYMDLKLAAIKELSYDDFIKLLLIDNKDSFKSNIILSLHMPKKSKIFWQEQLNKYNNDGLALKKSELFNTKYFNKTNQYNFNMYLNKDNYEIVKKRLDKVKIKFIHKDLKNLKINEKYSYMFLSNISDYLNLVYNKDVLIKYKDQLTNFLTNVETIYFAYLYDYNGSNRSEIDDINKVKEVFKNIEIKTFKSALNIKEKKLDGVLILRRN